MIEKEQILDRLLIAFPLTRGDMKSTSKRIMKLEKRDYSM